MKKKGEQQDVFFDDPGIINMAEVRAQIQNVERIPLWQMHPVVQHGLRMCQNEGLRVVERYDEDSCRWIENWIPGAQMLMEVYRIVPENFPRKFLAGTCIGAWNALPR